MTDFGRVTTLHKTSHQNAGSDEIAVTGLSGLLGDSQMALAHALGGTKHSVATLAALNALISNATLDTASATRTPAAHKTSHQSGGSDALTCALLAGRINYVDRGDPSSVDKTMSDFTTNGNPQTMDLSAIVPAGAIAIAIKCHIMDDAVGTYMTFWKNGNTYTINAFRCLTQVANVTIDFYGTVFCDAGRVIAYKGANLAFGDINLTVVGWYV